VEPIKEIISSEENMIYHTFWSRVAAAFIDTLLLWPLILIAQTVKPGTWDLVTITILVLQHSYYIIGHAQYGQTLGKKLVGVRVVMAHEHLPLKWKNAIMRELLRVILSAAYLTFTLIYLGEPDNWLIITCLAIALADCLIALIHPQNRSLRDFIAKTVVIRTSTPG
jgi:uncharacterized RDD family membrane protein YckC